VLIGKNEAAIAGSFGEHGPVARPLHHIGVESAFAIRHDHRQFIFGGIPFNRGPARPDGVVVAQSVQQIEHRVAAISAAGTGHADLGRHLLRQNDVHRTGPPENIRMKRTLQKCHIFSPEI